MNPINELIEDVTVDDVAKAFTDVGLRGRVAHVPEFGIKCAFGMRDGLEFLGYVQQGQSLCLQATIRQTEPGSVDVANRWNGWQRLSKALPTEDGYMLRFEADVSHGAAWANLMAIARKFGESLTTFRTMLPHGPGGR